MGRRPFTQQQCCIINRGHMPKSLLIPLIRDEIGFLLSDPRPYETSSTNCRSFRFMPESQIKTSTTKTMLSPDNP